MHKLLNSSIVSWELNHTLGPLPAAIDTICPTCGRPVNFNTAQWASDDNVHARTARGRCPACQVYASFFWVGIQQRPNQEDGRLYIHPTPAVIRQPIGGLNTASAFSESLARNYKAAIDTYNARNWIATAVVCRRVLEGIAHDMLPEKMHKLPLAQQLTELPTNVDLQKPILDLAHSLRHGGNFGAHFNAEREPDQTIATMMLDLLDYVIEYLYILPEKTSQLRDKVTGEEGETASDTSEPTLEP